TRAILAVLSLLAFAGAAQPQDKVLRIVPRSNLNILDPIWTTQYMARNHGYMVYDTLCGTDETNKIQPQVEEKWTESPDHRPWTCATHSRRSTRSRAARWTSSSSRPSRATLRSRPTRTCRW